MVFGTVRGSKFGGSSKISRYLALEKSIIVHVPYLNFKAKSAHAIFFLYIVK